MPEVNEPGSTEPGTEAAAPPSDATPDAVQVPEAESDYTLGIDLRATRPTAVISRDGAATPIEIGHVNSPNSPTGATWAVEEMIEAATTHQGARPSQVLVCPPEAWTADELDRLDRMLRTSDSVADHAIIDRPSFGTISDPDATQASPVISAEPAEPEVIVAPALPDRPPPAGTPLTYAELTNLPHIDDEPLPDFVRRRQADPSESTKPVPPPSTAAEIVKESVATASPSTAPPPAAADAPSPTVDEVPVTPATGFVDGPAPDDGDRRIALAFAIVFAIVAVGLATWLLTRGDDTIAADDTEAVSDGTSSSIEDEPTVDDTSDSETAASESDGAGSDSTETDGAGTEGAETDDVETTEAASEPEGVAAAADCAADQFPSAEVTYRVSDIPERFEAQTLNGRNVPSVIGVGGVDSRVITEFPEFSELDLTRVDCKLNENGRPWWGVTFPAGPDGIAWASTLYIEPMPAEPAEE